jgi:hypothetical protein
VKVLPNIIVAHLVVIGDDNRHGARINDRVLHIFAAFALAQEATREALHLAQLRNDFASKIIRIFGGFGLPGATAPLANDHYSSLYRRLAAF